MAQSRSEMLDHLEALLHEALKLRARGGAYAKLARAHGCIDGYMRALIELGVADQAELLKLVAEVRSQVDGPATRPMADSHPELGAA
jgi:hypothetical protein